MSRAPARVEEAPQLTLEEAEELTYEIQQAATNLLDLVVRAYSGRVWVPLGYDSWDAYCEEELDAPGLRVPREDRQEVVQSLREAGLSPAAIAAVTKTSRRTVGRALEQGGQNAHPASIGRDGKVYPAKLDKYHCVDCKKETPKGQLYDGQRCLDCHRAVHPPKDYGITLTPDDMVASADNPAETCTPAMRTGAAEALKQVRAIWDSVAKPMTQAEREAWMEFSLLVREACKG